ncbi:MAG: ABC transporter substrate-binding protein, partial [Janthinobacterium lividum]
YASSTCAAGNTADAAAALSGVTLNIGQNNGELEPLYRASGAFDGAPYKIRFSSFNNALQNYTALAAGNVDVSDSSITTALQLQQASAVPWTAATAPIKAVLICVSDYPGSYERYIIIAGSKSGINKLDAQTLKGKKFAYSPGANNFLVYLATLAYFGVKPSELHPIQLDTTANSLALLNNSVDLVSGTAELYGAALADGAKVVFSSKRLNGLPIMNGLVVNTQALNDPAKGAALKDFVKRYVAYQNWFTTQSDATKLAYVKGRQFTPTQAAAAWRSGRVLVKPVTAETIADAGKANDVLFNAGAFTKKLDVSVIFDDRFSSIVAQSITDLNYVNNLKTSLAASADK